MAGLYLHIPFCHRKCPYCDFYSIVADDERLIDDYVTALCRDQETSRTWFVAAPFSSVFFGGGTPSVLRPEQIKHILDTAQHHYGLTQDVEISMEVNPGTVDFTTLQGYRLAGVNRLSIGVQSFDDQQLRWLQRIHDSRQALETIDAARRAGFDRLNLDLMFALPGQTNDTLQKTCKQVAAIAPEHVALYGLTVEEGTPLAAAEAAGHWTAVDDEHYCRHYLLLSEQLGALGYEHYEISNFARPGEACRHNMGYWQRQPYLGIGAGAHSYLPDGWGERWHCPDDIQGYLLAIKEHKPPRQKIEAFSQNQAMSEAAYLALRCAAGIDDNAFEQRYGVLFSSHFSQAIAACGADLQQAAARYFFTTEGWLLFNQHIEHFLE